MVQVGQSETGLLLVQKGIVMKVAKANEVQFVFMCGELDIQTFSVASFNGKDFISKTYEFSIELRSAKSDIKSSFVLNKSATLFIYRDDEFYPYSGVIIDFCYNETTTDYSSYTVKLVPRLYLLDYNIQTRVFQKMTVPEIVKKVFSDSSLSEYYSFDLQGTFTKRELTIQYKESDLNFISRLLEDSGIWFFFKELPLLKNEIDKVNSEVVIFSDKPDSFKNINEPSEIAFRPLSGLVQYDNNEEAEFCYKLMANEKVDSRNVLVKNYNYQSPEVNISAQKTVDSGLVGTCYQYGGFIKDPEMAQKAASQLAKRIASEILVVKGESRCRGFRAGKRFTLKDHLRSDCNDTYLITSVNHTGSYASLAGGSDLATYSNEFSLLPSRRAALYAPQKNHRPKSINGIITAPIEANGSDYASLDERGRYKIRFPFDTSDCKNHEASKYIRLAQPYSGANYGIHFPSHEGTEMVLACIDGDPDKPLGIGTVPNANTASPVSSNNKEQSIIRTAGNNEIILDDSIEKQKIKITTATKNTAIFDDENKLILIQTADGNKLIIDDKNNVTSLTAKEHHLTMSYKDGSEGIEITSAKGHVLKIDDKNKILTIRTSSGHVIQMDDSSEKMMLADCKGMNSVTLDGGNGLVLDSKGNIAINASQDIEIKGANIAINASGKLDMNASQDMSISGMNINEKATSSCKINAANMEISANASVKITGNQTEISGAMTKVQGQGMLSLKGGMVMAN